MPIPSHPQPSSPSSQPGRLGVGIIGAGRVGSVLGVALRGVGHAVVGITADSQSGRERAEALLPEVPHVAPLDVLERAELVLLTVPDDELPGVVEGLAKSGSWQPGQIVVHTAGRFGVGVLQPALAHGVIPAAIHPMMSFTGTSMDLPRLREAFFAVTAPNPVLPIAQALVVEMGGEPLVVAEEQRPLLQVGLTHASEHAILLFNQVRQLFGKLGIEPLERILAPLMHSAIDQARYSSESIADTSAGQGNVARITSNVRAVAEYADQGGISEDQLRQVYLAMTTALAELAIDTDTITWEQSARILQALKANSQDIDGHR